MHDVRGGLQMFNGNGLIDSRVVYRKLTNGVGDYGE